MKRNFLALTACATAVSLLSGCATHNSKELATNVRQEVKASANNLTAANKRVVESRVVDSSYISGNVVDYVAPEKGSISLNISQQPLFAVFQSLAEQGKFSASAASDVDPKKLVTLDVRNATYEQAMREVAAAAGYVVVFDQARKTASLAETATYTFRLPNRVFNNALAGKFKMSNNPGSSGGGGGTGGGIGTTTDATVDGGTVKQSAEAFTKFVKELAGPDSEVQVLPDSGIITVRTKAQQLRRVHQTLTDYARFALTQVELEVSMMEVNLTDDMSSGIDWAKMLAVKGAPFQFNLTTASSVGTPAATMSYTNASVDAMVKLLESNTNARTLARQRFPAFNNSLSMMFDGKKVPYIGKVDQSIAGTSGTSTTTGEFTFAMDGISTAVYTNILDNNQVELTLMPVLATIEGFEVQQLGANTLKAPIQPLRQGHFPFIGKHGQTLIFGGGRYGKESGTGTGLPGVSGTVFNKVLGGNSKNMVQKELVFLVNTKVIPMTKFEPLVRESL